MLRQTAAGEHFGARPWRATLAGLCASLVGIGLARFAYTPLLPALIGAGWFSPSQAAYLGAANLAGYLAGALLAGRLATRGSAAAVLRAMMVLASASFFACAGPLPFAWFFVWRFASGLAGGVLMVLAAPTVLVHITPSRRGLAGGIIFTGVGLGIAASGTLVPLLLRSGLVATWCALGALALALTALAWAGWPDERPRSSASPGPPPGRSTAFGPALKALYLAYGLNALGLVPHMVFLVDFVARGLERGIATGAQCWVLFGLGAMIGPVLAGAIADRTSFASALRLAFLVQAVAIGTLALTAGPASLIISSIVVGAFVPGVVPLTLGRIQELLPDQPEAQKAAWGIATSAFALGQAAGAYGFSFLYAHSGAYALLFALAAGALLLALAIELGVAAVRGAGPVRARR